MPHSESRLFELAGIVQNEGLVSQPTLSMPANPVSYQRDGVSARSLPRRKVGGVCKNGLVEPRYEENEAAMPANRKEMQDAYEIWAALEEIGGRAAARVLKSNTAAPQRELEAMRAASDRLDLDSFVEHDVAFHRNILGASQNEGLLRVWDSLAVDLRIRALIGRISGDLPELVESHQSIVDALERGRGKEAGLRHP
jgi:DNA-binding GntR family transcriptional regulator